jgi:hypothetical protein
VRLGQKIPFEHEIGLGIERDARQFGASLDRQ